MNRREFIKVGVVGAGLTFVTPAAALATHVTESSEPIIGIGLDLYKYPQGSTKVSRRILIPETGSQPPSGVTTEPATVQVLDKIGPGGVVVSTIPAITWITYGSDVAFDSATGLPIIPGNIRTEPFVAIGKTARQNGIPSEHWDSRLTVTRVTDLERGMEARLWDTLIRHANIPPHDSGGGPLSFAGAFKEAEQDNDYPINEGGVAGDIMAGYWQLDGWATKRRFLVSTKFVWGG